MTRFETLRDSMIRQFKWPKAIALTGALGAGKTAWALNIAKALRRRGRKVVLADLDIINPYFCIREVAERLEEEEDIRVILPPEGARWIDLPVLSSAVTRALSSEEPDHVILDVGGEAKGVLALKQFVPFLEETGYSFLMVVNPFRPQSATSEQILTLRAEMEKLSELQVSGILGNPHLLEQTTPEDVCKGLAVIRSAGRKGGLPLHFCGVPANLYDKFVGVSKDESDQIWPISRMILFPWERGVAQYGEG